ncbi:MAG: HAD hydrolase family protein [Thermoproteus sp.]|jgi:phosphoserine phosphatase (EC 3.1.3.3)|nr:MAG: phosphoserine phosphatase [Thermoproteus sp. JCHS_4]MDT7870671.1 HAD hydrolase family protein [Thermoproteus sp.]
MRYRAVVLDVDGVLTNFRSAWKRIHDILGIDADLNRALYERGYIDYIDWAAADVALWRGVPRYVVEAPFRPREGFDQLCDVLRRSGAVAVAVSAGVGYTRRLSGCFAEFYVNDIIYDGDLVAGIAVEVTNANKAEVAAKALSRYGVSLDESIAVGDSETDLPLLESAGFSIAFNPTSRRVEEAADVVLRSQRLHVLAKYLSSLLLR